MIYISAANTARTVVIKDSSSGAGEILLKGSEDYPMNSTDHGLMLQRVGESWVEMFRPNITKYAIITETQPSGTAAGTFIATTWVTRTLNTSSSNIDGFALSANQFTLPPGSYVLEASAPAYSVNAHKTRLQNITAATTTEVGLSEESAGTAANASRSKVKSVFTVTVSTVFEIQHWAAQGFLSHGLGFRTISGVNEVYTEVYIEKILI